MNKSLLVMGGDRRMQYCAEHLSAAFDVHTYGFSDSKPIWELRQTDILVLPYLSIVGEYLNTPLISQKIPAVSALDLLKYGGTLYGGGLDKSFLSYCAERCAKVYDFFDDEDLTVENAALTAEGAAEIILKETEAAVCGADILILGFGRVAKACAAEFSALGAKITVAARSLSAREAARTAGYRANEFISKGALEHADVIINTVPSAVLGEGELTLIKKDALILDLSSKPYGTDFDAAKRLGIKALTAPGLPGKTAPKTAGRLIAEAIMRRERGERNG